MRETLTGAILATLLVLVSCRSSNTVSWEDAQRTICGGQVDYVAQNHVRQVTIAMKDGTQYKTVEPEIDEVNKVLKRCGKWGKVGYATE